MYLKIFIFNCFDLVVFSEFTDQTSESCTVKRKFISDAGCSDPFKVSLLLNY